MHHNWMTSVRRWVLQFASVSDEVRQVTNWSCIWAIYANFVLSAMVGSEPTVVLRISPLTWPANWGISDFRKTVNESRIRERNSEIYFQAYQGLWKSLNSQGILWWFLSAAPKGISEVFLIVAVARRAQWKPVLLSAVQVWRNPRLQYFQVTLQN